MGRVETPDAYRMALRLPALCGLPTGEEAEQVLDVSGARQQNSQVQVIFLDQAAVRGTGSPQSVLRV